MKSENAGFETRIVGERVEGLGPGVDRAHLVKLRRGVPEADAELELHGLRADEARAALRRAIGEAQDAGYRCVHVVHGRGLRSESGPVLKTRIPGWLSEPPLAAAVLAFCSATPADGGVGALYVLLRRRREGSRRAD